jgi:predicted nicotinamide N-methyase
VALLLLFVFLGFIFKLIFGGFVACYVGESAAAKGGDDEEHCYQTSIYQNAATATSTTVKVLNMNWADSSTYPEEKVDLILGSDLVYDISILEVLIPVICNTLSKGNFVCFIVWLC